MTHQIEIPVDNVENVTLFAYSHGIKSYKNLEIVTRWYHRTNFTDAFYRVYDDDKLIIETTSLIKAIAAYNQIS